MNVMRWKYAITVLVVFSLLLCILYRGFFSISKISSAAELKQQSVSYPIGYKVDVFFKDMQVVELCYALDERNFEKIDKLMVEGVNINHIGPCNITPLFLYFEIALWSGLADARTYCNYSPYTTYDTTTALPSCTQLYIDDRLRCIERLLYYGADPNIKIDLGDKHLDFLITPRTGMSVTFMSAPMYMTKDSGVSFNTLPAVLKYGGDPNILYEEYHITPIFVASNPSFCPDIKNKHQCYFLSINFPGICASPFNVGLLLEAGAEIDHRDKWRNTPLIAAAGGENFDIVLMLLEAGADYTAMNDDGQNLAYFLYVAKHMNPKIDTEESVDPYYNKVIAFLKSKDYSLENAYKELGDKLKNLPQPTENPNSRSSYQRPHDPYAGEWIEKRKEKRQ